jgi:hypothetical protein
MSLRGFGLAAALVALLPVTALLSVQAWAHGPTRQKLIETVEINAPIEKVWAVIGNFQDMGWHPAFAKTEGTGGNDVGATRILTTQAGGKVNEKLVKYDAEKKTLQYEITDVDVKVLPVTGYEAWFTLKGEGDKTSVEWKSKFYRGFVNNDPPPELSDDAAVAAVTGVFKTGLEALKKKIEGGS